MNRLLAALIFACCAASGQQIYDLLLKNGRVIDPANHRDGRLDVAVVGSRIVRVAPDLPEAHARVVVDVSGYMVTPGLIDIGAHFAPPLKPDYNTLPYGVTTVVDQGTTCEALPEFKKEVVEHAKVRVLTFLPAECASRETVLGVPRRSLPVADTIFSGMDWNSILVPRATMARAMSISLNQGAAVEQIIPRVTSNPARAIKRADLGALSEGSVADIAILEIQQGNFGFLDAARNRIDGTRRIRCLITVRNGVIVWDSDGLSVPDTIRAGPYTNFK
jgi:predicted amidohydrolase